jgi:hypothetical protein
MITLRGEQEDGSPLYSKKLHILVRLANTSCVTSLTILAFVLLGNVWNHLASLTFPVRVSSVLYRHDETRTELDGEGRM